MLWLLGLSWFDMSMCSKRIKVQALRNKLDRNLFTYNFVGFLNPTREMWADR